MANFNVPLTQSYRLVADSNNLVLQRRVIVDPTKAPGFTQRLAQDPTINTELSEKWRDDGYYSLSSAGLTAAINSAIIRTVVTNGCEDLADMLAQIRAEVDRISSAVDSVFNPASTGANQPAYGSGISGEGDALE